MLSHSDLRPGTRFILDSQPYEVLTASAMKMAQRRPVIQTKIKNLITGNVFERNFQQGDLFDEAELAKIKIKYLYNSKGQHFFCQHKDPSKRFSLTEAQIGFGAKFLKPDELVDGIVFDEKIINIAVPIKVQLKVKQAPPGLKGDRAQGGTKVAILESGAEVSVPLFIEEGDIIEVNTETGLYAKRI
ncbi:elongation factor P [Patescibacteria group bacterium]|nr:elongation factor P [Patescibacteria group bacterium]